MFPAHSSGTGCQREKKALRGRRGRRVLLLLTWVSDFRMKYLFGKYCDSKLEFVDAYDPELLECAAGFFARRA